MSVLFTVNARAFSSCVFDVDAKCALRSLPVTSVLVQCFTIQIHTNSSDTHKKPVVTLKRTRQSLEGVWWISDVSEQSLPHATSECQTSDTTSDPRCQSGQSAKNSVIFSGRDSSKNCGADQRLQISNLHLDKFPTPATFACWKMRFKTEVCTCS